MKIYYERLNGEKLCFVHAVKAVMENDETISAYAPNVTVHDPYGSGELGAICSVCFPEEDFLKDAPDLSEKERESAIEEEYKSF